MIIMKMIDISKGILTTPPYPGDPSPCLQRVKAMSLADECNLSQLTACVHTGTHADSPLHFLEGGKDIASMPPELFVGKCMVISASGVADAAFIHALPMTKCKILLVKDALFSENSAAALHARRITTIGTTESSVGDAAVHRSLMGYEIAILENLSLASVADGEYFLVALPVIIEGSEGAFVRAVLIEGLEEAMREG